KSNRSFSAPSLLATGKSPKSSHVSIAASHAVERLEGRVLLSVTNLGASADAHVRGGTFEHQNFGTATLLEVKDNTGDGYHRQSFLKFALVSVPADAGVVAANLQLYGSRNTNDAEIVVRGHSVADSTWFESGPEGITYYNMPPLGSA